MGISREAEGVAGPSPRRDAGVRPVPTHRQDKRVQGEEDEAKCDKGNRLPGGANDDESNPDREIFEGPRHAVHARATTPEPPGRLGRTPAGAGEHGDPPHSVDGGQAFGGAGSWAGNFIVFPQESSGFGALKRFSLYLVL